MGNDEELREWEEAKIAGLWEEAESSGLSGALSLKEMVIAYEESVREAACCRDGICTKSKGLSAWDSERDGEFKVVGDNSVESAVAAMERLVELNVAAITVVEIEEEGGEGVDRKCCGGSCGGSC